MQMQFNCTNDATATQTVVNFNPLTLTSLFTAVLTNPNANTDQFNLVAEFLTGLATATGVSITHPAILPHSLPLMLRIAAGESVPSPEPPTTTRVADDQRDTPYSALWTLCARLAESALTLETGLAPGSTLATELATNPSYQKLQSARADALEFLIRFCRCCGYPLNIWGNQKEVLVCRECANSQPERTNCQFPEISDVSELAAYAAEYDQVSQPFPYDLAPMFQPSPASQPPGVPSSQSTIERAFFIFSLNNALQSLGLAKDWVLDAIGNSDEPPPKPYQVEQRLNKAELKLEEVERFLERLAIINRVYPQTQEGAK